MRVGIVMVIGKMRKRGILVIMMTILVEVVERGQGQGQGDGEIGLGFGEICCRSWGDGEVGGGK